VGGTFPSRLTLGQARCDDGGSAVCAILVVGDLTRRAVQARDDAVAESELR